MKENKSCTDLYINEFIKSLIDFNKNNEAKYVKHIRSFGENLTEEKEEFFNSIICMLNNEEIEEAEKFLTVLEDAGDIFYATENFFQLFRVAREQVERDFDFICKNSELLNRKESIEDFVNNNINIACLVSYRKAADTIVDIFYNNGLYDELLKLKIEADFNEE